MEKKTCRRLKCGVKKFLEFGSYFRLGYLIENHENVPVECRRHYSGKDGEIMKMLTPAEVAERLNISYDTALHMIKHSGIAYLKIGRQYRVAESVINDLTSQDEVVIIDYDDAG